MNLSEQTRPRWPHALDDREINHPLNAARTRTETRYGTINGGEGHMTCRVVSVTLPYSGTVPSRPLA